MEDPGIDLMYAGGAVTTLPTSQRLKPVIGGALQMMDIKWMAITPEGASDVPNYTFITNPQRVRADLELIQRLVSPKMVYLHNH
ncbi:MAG: hypothetical protein M2R45_01304 [Verrucomicrobia subdivision 3 bacterium]|nr:hypothetical protein [Limisphaerales bacterium]MCS1415170.1 hypothetical protein [Limisphaerales bacterium]